jgi:hypothetical protein
VKKSKWWCESCFTFGCSGFPKLAF